MNANDQFFARDARVDAAAVEPLPQSRKIYLEGSRPDRNAPVHGRPCPSRCCLPRIRSDPANRQSPGLETR